MTAKNTVGSLRGAGINGTEYRVAADAGPSFIPSAWEITNVPSSGSNMKKMVRRSQDVTDIILLINADEYIVLKAEAEALGEKTLSLTTAAGDVFRSPGAFEMATYESEEGRLTVNFLPTEDWTVSPAEVS